MKINEAYSPARAIPQGWSALQRAPIPLLVGTLLLMFSEMQCGMDTDFEDFWDGDLRPLFGLIVLFTSVLSLFRFLLGVFVRPGFMRVAAATLRGESPPFESLFSGGNRFWDMLLWKFLRFGVLLGTGIVLCVPVIPFGVLGGVAGANDAANIGILLGVAIGFYLLLVALPAFIYVETGLYFGRYLVVLENQNAMTALRTSWKETSGHRLWLLLYRVLMSIFTGIGVFFFLIGGVVTWAITELGSVRAFLDWRAGSLGEATPPRGSVPSPPTPVVPPEPVSPPTPAVPPELVSSPVSPVSPVPTSPPAPPAPVVQSDPPTPPVEPPRSESGGSHTGEDPSSGDDSSRPSGPGSTSN